ncbi:MAG: polysaccharide biosynthesis protein [Planctomycetia bacterium]|nr:polysaccharide biosynthesis protein [Planctomycetia bacterium]
MNVLLSTSGLGTRPLSRRSAGLLAAHAALFAAVYWFAFFTRYDFAFDPRWFAVYAATVGPLVALKAAVFYALGLCHVSWRRVAFGDLLSLLWAATLSMLVLAAIDGLVLTSGRFGGVPHVPRGVILLDWAATILLIGGIRAVWRSVHEDLRPLFSRQPARRALIVGADQAGELLARNLMAASRSPYVIVGFLADDPALHHTRFSGIEVLGDVASAGAEVARRGVDDVLVRSGAVTGRAFRRLLAECTAAGATVKVMPAIDELEGVTPDDRTHMRLRPVEIEDVLRREPVRLDDPAVAGLVAGRTVLVTGAGGSIGAEIGRQVARFHPRRLLLVDRAENALFALEQEFGRLQPPPAAEFLVADVGDEERMERIVADGRPDVIFHAAAHKHVPLMEANPAEAVKNNCLATRLLALLADRQGVGTFVLVSTDKAVRPASVMGCSKLIAERYVQALSKDSETRFIVVRFGNVLGSSGSVVPTFQEQIRRGGPVTVTHPEIERFFMLIPEAVQLVLQAAALGRGGGVFVLDMGERVKIVDLARDLITLSGLTEDDVGIVFTGLRPGEKLFEELYFEDERRVATSHPKVFCAVHRPVDLAAVEGLLEALRDVLDDPPDAIRTRLQELVPEYAPRIGCSLSRRE